MGIFRLLNSWKKFNLLKGPSIKNFKNTFIEVPISPKSLPKSNFACALWFELGPIWGGTVYETCPFCEMPTGFHNHFATLTPPADFVCETESWSEALSWALRCQIVFSILATMSQSPLLNECTAMNESYFSLCSLIASLCLTIAPCNDVLNAHRSVRSIFA